MSYLRPIALTILAAEGFLLGYGVAKSGLDKRIAAALKNKATDAIAYAKAVPPAPLLELTPELAQELVREYVREHPEVAAK